MNILGSLLGFWLTTPSVGRFLKGITVLFKKRVGRFAFTPLNRATKGDKGLKF